MMKEKLLSHLNFEPPALREVGLKLAKTADGINLAQGLCLMPAPPIVFEGAFQAMNHDQNRYSPAAGIPQLREAIRGRLGRFNHIQYGPDEVIATAGSTGAFEAVCESFLQKGDEIITFIPAYPYHQYTLERKQITVRHVPLRAPFWEIDWEVFEKSFTTRTKFVLLITPHNPTGKVFTKIELEKIGALCRKHNAFCVTDEVYEYMTYDGHVHTSMASLPGMKEHTITMGSYSKTFAITGWRIGYLAAPLDVIENLRAMSDQIYVCPPTPLQHGVALGIQELPDDYYEGMCREYKKKRGALHEALEHCGLEPISPQGGYYTIAKTSKRFPGKSSEEVASLMVEKAHVGAVPASDFMGLASRGDQKKSDFLRFCFAVPDAMLEEAMEKLRTL